MRQLRKCSSEIVRRQIGAPIPAPVDATAMNDVVGVEKLEEWQRLKALVLDGVSSSITRRLYNMALDDF